MENLQRLSAEQLRKLVYWYNPPRKSYLNTKASRIDFLNTIPEIRNNVQEIINNIREISESLRATPHRPNQNTPLPIPRTPQPIIENTPPTPQPRPAPKNNPDLRIQMEAEKLKPKTKPAPRKLAPNFIKPQKPSNKTFNWGNYSFKVMDKDEFSKKLTDLTNENIIKLTNNKQPQPKPRKGVNISDSVRDELVGEDFTPIEQETGLNGYLKTYRIHGKPYKTDRLFFKELAYLTPKRIVELGLDELTFIREIKQKVIDLINKQKKPLKLKFTFVCKFVKIDYKNGNLFSKIDAYTEPFFHSKKPEVVTASTDLSSLFDVMTDYLLELFKDFKKEGSGWVFNGVKYFDIKIDPFEPISGSSYIPLPEKLANKGSIINPRNENDNECFKWSVTEATHPREKNPQRVNRELIENSKNFNWKGIEFPAKWVDISKFEKQNQNYRINVYGYDNDNEEVYPLRISDKERGLLINLLLISNDETDHYCWIKNLCRLTVSQVTKHKERIYLCPRCLYHTHKEETLQKHLEYCKEHEAVRGEMPTDKHGKPIYLKFINFYKKLKVPFVVYGDFECCGESIDTCSPDKSKSFTNKYAKHKPAGYCYIIKFFDENYEPLIREYTAKSPDEDVGKIFMIELEKDIREICEKIKPNKKMNWMTQREKFDYNKATHCYICEEELLEKDKVKDHCHYTGKYRGAAHSTCNLNFKNKKFIPIIFHNLSGYDSHLFIKNIGITKGKVGCIPNNEEKYIFFYKTNCT